MYDVLYICMQAVQQKPALAWHTESWLHAQEVTPQWKQGQTLPLLQVIHYGRAADLMGGQIRQITIGIRNFLPSLAVTWFSLRLLLWCKL
jgi:hypothetical protein